MNLVELIQTNSPDLVSALENEYENKPIENQFIDNDQNNLIIFAAKKGDPKLLKLFLTKIKDVENIVNNINANAMTALHYAAIYPNDNGACLELLVEKGAKLDVQNRVGFTPLMLAAREGNAENVRILIENNANKNISDYLNKKTALDYATSEAIKNLLSGNHHEFKI